MRRVNKILMATVAILLCLVLISTSVVSGIFAKYIVQKQAQISATIEKFGVKVYFDASGAKAAGATVEPNNEKDAATVTITNLNLKPGDNIPNALKIRFEGKTTVPLMVTITFHVNYVLSDKQFFIPGNAGIGAIEYDTYMLPVGFKFGTEKITISDSKETIEPKISSDYVTQLKPYFHWSANNLEIYLARKLRDALAFTAVTSGDDYTSNSNNAYAYKTFKAGDTIQFKNGENTLVFGYEWPEIYPDDSNTVSREYNYDTNGDGTKETFTVNYDSDTLDRVSAYLSQNGKNKTIPITYTVKIEQTGA